MKYMLLIPFFSLLFLSCSKDQTQGPQPACKPSVVLHKIDLTPILDKSPQEVEHEAKIMFKSLPRTHLIKRGFDALPNWEKESYYLALQNFKNSCEKSSKTKKMYSRTCRLAKRNPPAKEFIEKEFAPYEINTNKGESEGLLTGYYEPELQGSRTKTKKYKYPIYATPKDLIIVDLGSIYPALKNYRLRGKVVGNKLIPYDTRKQSHSKHVPAEVVCYTDSEIDLFFLEIQGSGRVNFENGESMFIGYANQNGHKYRAIGRYLVRIGALKIEEVSLQSIRAWLERNPSRVREVLNYNKSVVYFEEREVSATGSLGVCLTANRSIAVDRRYIPLGSMLYLDANIEEKQVSKVVLAQDTGGAIKGAVRADLFLGCGEESMQVAGRLKSPLKLWMLLPKSKEVDVLN